MANIIVVDDDQLICKMISLYLGSKGHKVSACYGGMEGGRSILEQQPDLVLLDLCMPNVDGFDLLSALKSDPWTKQIPVVVMSALTDIESLGRVAALRAAGYLRKPIVGTTLIETIERVLKSHVA